MGPRAAEWGPYTVLLQSMGPRAAEWARAPRYYNQWGVRTPRYYNQWGSARRGMGPHAAVLFECHFTDCEFFPLIHTNISK